MTGALWAKRGERDISRGARSARRGEEKTLRAPREISRSPRLAHKAPVMQAKPKAGTGHSYIVRDISLTEIYRWLVTFGSFR